MIRVLFICAIHSSFMFGMAYLKIVLDMSPVGKEQLLMRSDYLMNKDKIWLSSPHMCGKEVLFVQEAFETNWISPVGPHLVAFEKELAEYCKVSDSAVLSSGTAAIHLALIMLDVKRGDEVICSSFTFSASCNPIAYQGARPVFVDSEEESWNMDPVLLRKAIIDRMRVSGKKPKAVILVHLYGVPARLDEILAICSEYDIPLIEDAAEALGSRYQGSQVGTFGLMGIFSFNGNKIITTSGGGALIAKDTTLLDKARFLSTQARDQAPHYQHSEIGYNYRLSNVAAGIGRGQLMVLDEWVRRRRQNFDYYRTELGKIPGFTFPEEIENCYSNRWLTTILVDPEKTNGVTRETLRLELDKENIESRPLWKPMHCQPVFADAPAYVNGVSERLFESGLCLPSGSNLKQEDLERVTDIVKKCLE
jgi:dTDP-4-amino-4,6-dideoxygalactose transaminase